MAVTKGIDPQVTKAMQTCIEQRLATMSGIPPSEPPQAKDLDIAQYEGRMRVNSMEKLNSPAYISSVNFYLNAADLERHKARGAMVLYMDFENAGKMLHQLGIKVPDDEDDISMIAACGELCTLIGTDFKNALTSLGYADLVMSPPRNYKNSAMGGVEFSPDQTTKHELCFFYWKRKAVVVELTLAPIPTKK